MRALRSFVLVLVALASLPAAATTVRYAEVEELSRSAALVVHGTVAVVTGLNLGSTERPTIVTEVVLTVHRTLVGQTPGPELTIRLIGGSVGGHTLRVPGQPTFVVGEEVVLFLEWTGDRLAVSGMGLGKYLVGRRAGEEPTAARNLDGLCLAATDGEGGQAIEHRHGWESALPLAELFRRIRAARSEEGTPCE